jgi:acetoin utilization deacetylase AcuC-like enzyme
MTNVKTQVYLLFDERMALHRPVHQPDNPNYYPVENSNRIFKIYGSLLDLEKRLLRQSQFIPGIMPHYESRFVEFPCKPVDRETVELVHTPEHYDWLYHTMFLSEAKLRQLTDPDDLYVCSSTFLAALLSCGGAVQCVDAVTSGRRCSAGNKITRAIALIRPPGHHALKDSAMGKQLISCAHMRTVQTNQLMSFYYFCWKHFQIPITYDTG